MFIAGFIVWGIICVSFIVKGIIGDENTYYEDKMTKYMSDDFFINNQVFSTDQEGDDLIITTMFWGLDSTKKD